MRSLLLIAHRWAGLATAAFLALAGLTGAVIAWDHELDGALNPAFYEAPGGAALSTDGALLLADRLEAEVPALRVSYLPLTTKAGEVLRVSVAARDGHGGALPYNQVALDPDSGRVQGQREWGALSLSREHFFPMLYRLHYSLHLPDEAGLWVMGLVAILATIDAVVALLLSFPTLSQWRKSFAFRLRSGGAKALFDLHRSSGVWTWLLVLTVAVTGVSMNLGREVVRPLLGALGNLSPTAEEVLAARPGGTPHGGLTRAAAVARAQEEAARLGVTARPGGIFEDLTGAYFGVGFFAPGEEHADGRLGNPWIYVDKRSGEVLARDLPDRGTVADFVWRAQFPLHSGRLGGVWGRALVSVLGLMVAGLSVTGVLLWLRRRAAHRRATLRKAAAEPRLAVHPKRTAHVGTRS